MMKITFLGTGTSQGVPVIACNCPVCHSDDPRDKRLRSSLMIESGDTRIVIDCGPDFRQQMLQNNVHSIDAILITHSHKDHIGGLDDVRAFNYILQKPADVYVTKEVKKIIILEYAYAFGKERYPGVPEIALHSFGHRRFTVAGVDIIPVKVRHFNEQFIFGFRIGDFTYITDAVEIPKQEMGRIKGSKIIVINALRKQKHYSHFCLSEALKIIEELKPERAYLTHVSHQMGKYKDIMKEVPSYVEFAYDGLSFFIN